MADNQANGELLRQGWLQCNLIIEIVGKPKEHVEQTLKDILRKIEDEKNVEVIAGKVHEPKEQGKFFSSFAEVEAMVKDLATFATLCFEYMPSSVEIVEPAQLKIDNLATNDFINDMLARLHDVDMRFKNVNATAGMLNTHLEKLLTNFVLVLLGQGPQNLDFLAARTGIKQQELQGFLDKFEEQKLIAKDGDKYKRP